MTQRKVTTVLAAVALLAGCGEQTGGGPMIDEERIAEAQERIESMARGSAAELEIDGKLYSTKSTEWLHVETDYLEIRRLAKEHGLNEAETDALVDRMKDAEKKPPTHEMIEIGTAK